jgi:hypothetical protein
MKTLDQFRQRKLDYLQFVLKCPERCGVVDQEIATWLSDMLFIDERFGAWEKEKKRLELSGRYSTLGVKGPLAWGLPRPLRQDFKRPLGQECVSVYAEVLYRLGYLQPDRLLPAAEWRAIKDSLQLFTRGDWHPADVVARFGEPSVLLNSNNPLRRCQCYASTDKDLGWICLDYEFLLEGYATVARGTEATEDAPASPPTIDGGPWHEHPDHADGNPLLRDVRFPAKSFDAGLILTEYAKRIQLNPFGMFPQA